MLKLKSQKGFTLIELLIVIAILGILAAGAILGIQGFIGKGQLESINTEVASLQTASLAYISDNPSDEEITVQDLMDAGLILKNPSGTYEFSTDGDIEGTDNPYDFEWNADANEWVK